MEAKYIVGIDEGTTSVRAVLFNIRTHQMEVQAKENIETFFPEHGWVEQDANQIWQATKSVLDKVLLNVSSADVIGIGITNQRETVVAWNKSTGEPVCPAIVWQCRRTSKRCEEIPAHVKRKIKKQTGLICDAYFSATKMEWLLKNNDAVKKLETSGNLCFGTIDSYLAYKLTNKHVTDATNASRTMLFSLKTNDYSPFLLKYFNIKKECLPSIVSCSQHIGMATTAIGNIPLLAMIGDQQSALFAQSLLVANKAKCTFGTGAFVMMGTGTRQVQTKSLVTTVACKLGDITTYALEGSIFNSGDALQFLKQNLGMLKSEAISEEIANSIESSSNVYFVPAFTGLGSPHWDPHARACILGMEKNTTKAHIVRACLEGNAFCVYDILNQMQNVAGRLCFLQCNGGGAKNRFMMQWLSNLIEMPVHCSTNTEQTVLGAIYLAGLAGNVFTIEKLEQKNNIDSFNTFLPKEIRNKNQVLNQWKKAVEKSKDWTN